MRTRFLRDAEKAKKEAAKKRRKSLGKSDGDDDEEDNEEELWSDEEEDPEEKKFARVFAQMEIHMKELRAMRGETGGDGTGAEEQKDREGIAEGITGTPESGNAQDAGAGGDAGGSQEEWLADYVCHVVVGRMVALTERKSPCHPTSPLNVGRGRECVLLQHYHRGVAVRGSCRWSREYSRVTYIVDARTARFVHVPRRPAGGSQILILGNSRGPDADKLTSGIACLGGMGVGAHTRTRHAHSGHSPLSVWRLRSQAHFDRWLAVSWNSSTG